MSPWVWIAWVLCVCALGKYWRRRRWLHNHSQSGQAFVDQPPLD